MTHQEPPRSNSEDSVSYKAHRDAESIADLELLQAAREAVVIEKDKKKRSSLYFVVSKVAVKVDDQDAGAFLIQQLQRESDKYVLMSLLDRISELPKRRSTDITPIIDLTKDKRWQVRHSAIQALKRTDSPIAEQTLIDILMTSSDAYDIVYANATLNRIGTTRAIPAIEQHRNSRKRDVKMSASFAIEEIRKREAEANKTSLPTGNISIVTSSTAAT